MIEKSKYIGGSTDFKDPNDPRKASGRIWLEVYECRNGFHIGLDGSYLDQMSDIDVDRLCEDIIEEKYDQV